MFSCVCFFAAFEAEPPQSFPTGYQRLHLLAPTNAFKTAEDNIHAAAAWFVRTTDNKAEANVELKSYKIQMTTTIGKNEEIASVLIWVLTNPEPIDTFNEIVRFSPAVQKTEKKTAKRHVRLAGTSPKKLAKVR